MVIFFLISYMMHVFYAGYSNTFNVIAVNWGDSKYGNAFYGAYLYGTPKKDHISVSLTIHIGRGTPFMNYKYDLGEIGTAKNMVEAVKSWGTMTWSQKGLAIGSEQSTVYFLERSKIESHR